MRPDQRLIHDFRLWKFHVDSANSAREEYDKAPAYDHKARNHWFAVYTKHTQFANQYRRDEFA